MSNKVSDCCEARLEMNGYGSESCSICGKPCSVKSETEYTDRDKSINWDASETELRAEPVPASRLLNKREVFLTHGELAGKLDLAMVEIASLKADRKRLLLELHEQDLRLKANQPG